LGFDRSNTASALIVCNADLVAWACLGNVPAALAQNGLGGLSCIMLVIGTLVNVFFVAVWPSVFPGFDFSSLANIFGPVFFSALSYLLCLSLIVLCLLCDFWAMGSRFLYSVSAIARCLLVISSPWFSGFFVHIFLGLCLYSSVDSAILSRAICTISCGHSMVIVFFLCIAPVVFLICSGAGHLFFVFPGSRTVCFFI